MTVPNPQGVQAARKRFSPDEYERMVAAGVLSEDDRLELIQGEIVEMAPIGSLHLAHVNRLTQLFVRSAGAYAQVSVQNPVRLADSEPQPDLALLRPRPDYYAQALPGPLDVLLLIEVSDTTAGYDRSIKIPLYGRSGVAETWLIDLTNQLVEVYREPSPTGYRTKQPLGPGGHLTPAEIPGLTIATEDLI